MSTKFTLIPASDMLVFAPVCDFSAIENILFEVKNYLAREFTGVGNS
jgi:hypothetical protein